jgi:hypothetical protein
MWRYISRCIVGNSLEGKGKTKVAPVLRLNPILPEPKWDAFHLKLEFCGKALVRVITSKFKTIEISPGRKSLVNMYRQINRHKHPEHVAFCTRLLISGLKFNGNIKFRGWCLCNKKNATFSHPEKFFFYPVPSFQTRRVLRVELHVSCNWFYSKNPALRLKYILDRFWVAFWVFQTG